MQKKWWLILAIAAIAVVGLVSAGLLFFLNNFKPPVDISGISISPALEPQELLPARLINGSLNRGLVSEGRTTGYSDGSEYQVITVQAEYGGITLRVFKAETEAEAATALDQYYSDSFGDYSSSSQEIRTPSWLSFEGGGTSGFAWKSGTWVFGVEAGDSITMKQAVAEWVQVLRG